MLSRAILPGQDFAATVARYVGDGQKVFGQWYFLA